MFFRLSLLLAFMPSLALAQINFGPQDLSGYATTGALTTVQAAIPTPLGTVPPAATSAGAAGTPGTYLPGNAVPLVLCRRTTVIAAADGSFSMTWTTPLVSTTPWAAAAPIWANTTMPPMCWIKTATNTGLTGQCSPTQTVALNLSIVTAGLTVNPFGANTGAAGLAVKVSSCEPAT